jgi:hypothetical protein
MMLDFSSNNTAFCIDEVVFDFSSMSKINI